MKEKVIGILIIVSLIHVIGIIGAMDCELVGISEGLFRTLPDLLLWIACIVYSNKLRKEN